jgi:hypothetical protein
MHRDASGNAGMRRHFPALALVLVAVSGCSLAPSQTILGSYFPSWMVCALAGIGASVVMRQLLVATGVGRTLPAPLVVYLALAAAFAFATWLIWLD